jgi:two-component system, cell cycle sensor histidine kinase and response regulator CckA
MAVRVMAFAHSSPLWIRAALFAGALGMGAVAYAGYGQIVLSLLAAIGASAAVLFAAGQLSVRRGESGLGNSLPQILSALPAAAAISDRKGILLWRSEAFQNAAGGLGLEQDLSRLGEKHPETAAAIFRLFAAARRGCAHAETIALSHFANGEPARLKVTPFSQKGQRPDYFIWQIESEPLAGSSDAWLGKNVDLLPVPALLVGKDLSVQAANRLFEKLLGSSPAGVEAWELFRTKRGKPYTRAWLRDTISKAAGPVAVQIACARGRFQSASLHWSAEGEAGYLLLLTPSGAAGNLDETFEALLGLAPSAMALTNGKGIVQAGNEAFRALLGKELASSAELAGKHLGSLLADQSATAVRDKFAELSAAPGVRPVELLAALKEEANSRVRLVIFPAAAGNNFVVLATETTAPVLLDEQAAQSQKMQAVGELAGGIAHDFNNLLTAIIGNSDLLLRRFRASDPAFKDLMDIKNSATRAAELVKQILAYSRRQTLRPAILKLTDVIEEFQATMGRTLGEKVKAKVKYGRDLWFVKADEGQLFQVIMNLAVNARDAMPDGGEIAIRTANISERESLALKERGLDRGEYVLCEVKDAGTGIKPEHLEKIFDPFFSTKEVGKGTGLGLSTVYGIVKQTGGTIIVDSQLGVGTNFRIYLPRYVETEEDLKALEAKAEAPEKIADLTGQGTVLLVEDEDSVRSFASRALATRGYKVLEAASGVEALEIMDREHGHVDLVVSDVVMPEMDGPTLLRHLRERNPGIRIVFMSGYAEEAFRKNLSSDEEFVFLPKPFTLKKLAETVKAAAA